jgi:hypothetical protein
VEAVRAKKDSPWSAAKPPAGQKLVGEKVNSLLATLTALRFSDTADPKDPSAAEAAKFMRTIRLTTFDGTTVLVSLGRRPEEKKLKVPTADAKDAITPPAKDAPAAPEAKPIAPEFDTIPAGPAFVVVSSSDPKAQVNDLMKRRSFKVDDYTLTGLPQKPDEFFEPEKAK